MISGCSSNDDVSPDDLDFGGSFEVSLMGNDNREMTGNASFVHGIVTTEEESENGSLLTITLLNEKNQNESLTLLIGRIGDLDGVNEGNYQVNIDSEDDEPYTSISGFLNNSMIPFLSTSGEIELMRIEQKLVKGNLNATLDNQNGEIIKVTGSFEALGITEKL
jgi:hypothetical protein